MAVDHIPDHTPTGVEGTSSQDLGVSIASHGIIKSGETCVMSC
jgi:hypothetical protein